METGALTDMLRTLWAGRLAILKFVCMAILLQVAFRYYAVLLDYLFSSFYQWVALWIG